MKSRRVLVDFDGVIKKRGDEAQPAVDGALDSIKQLKKLGYEVVVFTSRARDEAGKDIVHAWLDDHGVDVDAVTAEKIEADYYFDDRAVRIDENKGWNGVVHGLSG